MVFPLLRTPSCNRGSKSLCDDGRGCPTLHEQSRSIDRSAFSLPLTSLRGASAALASGPGYRDRLRGGSGPWDERRPGW